MKRLWLCLYRLSARKLRAASKPVGRPNLDDLETLLNSESAVEVVVLPDGEVITV